jgi:hypothetical protein
MSSRCPICDRTFSRRTAYSQHVQVCLRNADEEFNNGGEVDTQSIDNEEHSNVEIDTQNNEECEMDDNENDNIDGQDMSFNSIESTRSELISEMSIMSLENILESDILESDTLESDTLELANTEFPNEAYKDLMVLVTNYKLSNKAGNGIIQFFNKHSNLTNSPLPKNIEIGREFMNNMKFPLEFDKVFMTTHNDKDYFLYCQNLINCVKNIIAIPDVTKNFALSFENYKVKMFNLNYPIIFYFNFNISIFFIA